MYHKECQKISPLATQMFPTPIMDKEELAVNNV